MIDEIFVNWSLPRGAGVEVEVLAELGHRRAQGDEVAAHAPDLPV
jgi:hypothetical protein